MCHALEVALKVLFCFLFLCQLFVGCTRENRGDTSRQSGRCNAGIFTLTGIPMKYEGKFVVLVDDYYLIGVERIHSMTNDYSSSEIK